MTHPTRMTDEEWARGIVHAWWNSSRPSMELVPLKKAIAQALFAARREGALDMREMAAAHIEQVFDRNDQSDAGEELAEAWNASLDARGGHLNVVVQQHDQSRILARQIRALKVDTMDANDLTQVAAKMMEAKRPK